MSDNEQEQGKRKRAARKVNPISPYTRILTLHGLDGVKAMYLEATQKGIAMETLISVANLKHVTSPALQVLEGQQTTAEPVRVICRVLPGNSDTYPTHKVSSPLCP